MGIDVTVSLKHDPYPLSGDWWICNIGGREYRWNKKYVTKDQAIGESVDSYDLQRKRESKTTICRGKECK